MKEKGAIVIGGDFQALGVIRSLYEKKIKVILIETEKCISRYSTCVYKVYKKYNSVENGQIVEFLKYILAKEKTYGWVVYPNDDECVKILAQNKKYLEKYYKISVPRWDVVKNIYYKQNTYKIASSIGIATPIRYRLNKKSDYKSFKYPLVLKPSNKKVYFKKTKKKAVLVKTEKDFLYEYNKMIELIGTEETIIQEYISGGTKNLFSYAALFDGKKMVAGMSANRLRQHPMDFGQATTYAEARYVPELKELSEKLLLELGYYGLAEVEFMRDENSGKYKFIEINARPWGWHTLTKAAGLNIPYLLFRMLNKDEMEEYKIDYRQKWIRLLTDIPTVFEQILKRKMGIFDYIDTLRGKKEFAVFSIKDPLPFFVEFALVLYLIKKRGF